MYKFTKATSNPSETFVAPVVPGIYEDMRGNRWLVMWKPTGILKGGHWVARPAKDAAAAYGLSPDKIYSAASDAEMLIDGIEERLEIARVDAKSAGGPGGPLLFFAMLAYLVWEDGK